MGKPICISEMISVVTSTVMMYLFVGWKTVRDVAKGGGGKRAWCHDREGVGMKQGMFLHGIII